MSMRFLSACSEIYYHDPAVALLRACEARLVSEVEFASPLLDLGSGVGSFLTVLQPGVRAIAFDRESTRVQQCAELDRVYAGGVAGEAQSLPFSDNSFASVLANSSLEHMHEMESVLAELRRILRPGGELVLTVHTQGFATRMWCWPRVFSVLGLGFLEPLYRRARLRRLGIVSLFDDQRWQKLLELAGFEVETVQPYMAPSTEAVFERELVQARLGIWRVHLSSVARLAHATLSLFGVESLARGLARWHVRRLQSAYLATTGPTGAAVFVRARVVAPVRRKAAGELVKTASDASSLP